MKLLYEAPIAMRWSDMDALGHVNHARYLTYFEICRTSWLKSLGIGFGSEQGFSPVLAHVEADYIKPLVYPANTVVKMYGDKPGSKSLKTFYHLVDVDKPDTLYVKGASVLVWFDTIEQKSILLPKQVTDCFK